MQSFNKPPTSKVIRHTKKIAIGYRHKIIEDESGSEIKYELNGSGNYIETTYEIPTGISAERLIGIFETVTQEDFSELIDDAFTGSVSKSAELLRLVLGDDTVNSILTDPTVDKESIPEFFAMALSTFAGLDETVIAPEDEDGSPLG